ncbi:magnesium transporter CorA family protein [Kibdelosporangium persicum]|uniref:Magnesium and cobalt transport protein CorA n=1 Tax=Kibdelosporangium persicum TaxID=2698649 RepID=A0ABX2EZN7_9PSEU|nr:magnesium transporter CorA family protein [Kibdelosporangium persicum]NRN64216.1 Magnesium and cobalt transport protein CorA [Kibdelosporangium persicum]
MTRSRVYREGRLESEDFPPGRLTATLADPGTVVWVDLAAPDEDDLARLTEALELHPLAVEDAVQQHQRPKFSHYPGHGLVICHAVEADDSGELIAHELAVIVAEQTVVTVRKDPGFDMDKVVERWDSGTMVDGVGYLLHGILDYVADSYLDVAQLLDDRVEALEDEVFTQPPNSLAVQRESLSLHKSVGGLRRKVTPMREVIAPLLRPDNPIYDERMRPYFQDVLDHVIWASEQVESLRDLVATIRDTQLNLQGNRMNLIMKKVTSWAAIIAVPTAITGFYGQNLPVPGFERVWGFWLSTVVIAVTSIALYATFKRKDWL